jgi:hypothetical protein
MPRGRCNSVPDQTFWTSPRIAGALLTVAVIPFAVGATLYFARVGPQGGASRTPALFIVERGSIMTAVILTALGFVVLEAILEPSPGGALGRVGAAAYFFGAVLLVAAEAMGLSASGTASYPLIVVYVVMALLGQAAIGAAILQSGLLPAWVGWAAVAWNLGWLVVLPLAKPRDMYFPFLHHIAPLLIGVPLLMRG